MPPLTLPCERRVSNCVSHIPIPVPIPVPVPVPVPIPIPVPTHTHHPVFPPQATRRRRKQQQPRQPWPPARGQVRAQLARRAQGQRPAGPRAVVEGLVVVAAAAAARGSGTGTGVSVADRRSRPRPAREAVGSGRPRRPHPHPCPHHPLRDPLTCHPRRTGTPPGCPRPPSDSRPRVSSPQPRCAWPV